MSDNPSRERVEKFLPLLRQLDDAYVKLRIGQGLRSAYDEVVYNKSQNKNLKYLRDFFIKDDYTKFSSALEKLEQATRKGFPLSLEEIQELLQSFEKELEGTSSVLRRKFKESYEEALSEKQQRRGLDDKELAEKLITDRLSVEQHLDNLKKKKVLPKEEEALPEWEKPSVEEEKKPSWESPKIKQWPKWEKKDQPGIKRVLPQKEIEEIREQITKLTPILSAIIESSAGSHEMVGGDRVDYFIDLLDKGLSFDQFFKTAWAHLPGPFKANIEHLQNKLDQKRKEAEKDETKKPKLLNEILKLEVQIQSIGKMKEDLKFLYDNWTPHFMEKKAGEKSYYCKKCNKNLHDHDEAMVHEDLGHYVETREEPWSTPAEIIPEITPKLPVQKEAEEHAGKKFIQPRTPSEAPKREMLCDGCGLPITKQDVSYVVDNKMYHGSCKPVKEEKSKSLWEKIKGLFKAAAPIESLIKKEQKGPSAEEEKYIVEEIVNHLNSSGAQGAESEITKIAYEYFKSKAPHFDEENLQRVARKSYAEWKARQPVPSDVGSEGAPGVGVANMGGTGVYVEPSRGNANVQNTSPTGTVRKEAKYSDEALAKGTLVELEHFHKDKSTPATNEQTAKAEKVALDHLDENEHYYDEMEMAPKGEEKLVTTNLKISASDEYVCWNCDTGYHERCRESKCTCCHGNPMEKEADLGVIARIVKRKDGYHVLAETGRHMGGPYESREQAQKRLQQVEMFKHMKGAAQGDSNMNFEVGETAILNKRVGKLAEGSEVTVTSVSDGEVVFTADNILGITKVAHLDKATIVESGLKPTVNKIAASDLEKYQWENDGLKFKFNLGDRVKFGAIEYEGIPLKGKEGFIREKVVMATNGDAEKFYLVEAESCGHSMTLPEESMSKCGEEPLQAHRAINKEELPESLKKEAVLFPNVKFVEEFLKSYKHPPTVVTIADIEAFAADEKRSYVITKKDMKDIIKQLQSARVEVRVPVAKEAPEEIVKELAPEGMPETPPAEGVKKVAVKYKYVSPDGKTTTEREVAEDMGPTITIDNPLKPGEKLIYNKASREVCSSCNGEGKVECSCMDDANIWGDCTKCADTGWVDCSCKSNG